MKRILFLFFPIFIFGQDITLDWLNTKPRSQFKDFYIWRYLNTDVTPQQADEAFYQTSKMNDKILDRWIERSDDEYAKEYLRCKKLKVEEVVKEKDVECIMTGLSIYNSIVLNKKDRVNLIKKLSSSDVNQTFTKAIEITGTKSPFSELMLTDKNVFFEVFNKCGKTYREENFNRTIPPKMLETLSSDKEFEKSITYIVTSLNLDKMQQSLFDVNSTNYSHETNFLLGVNATKYGKVKEANIYFDLAQKKAYFQNDKDKVIFWKYLLNNDDIYLMKLSQSWDLNFYSLYAMEKLGIEPTNVVSELQYKNKKAKLNIKDPFEWLKILDDKSKLTDEKMMEYFNLLSAKDTLPHLAFLLEKASNYRKFYYITPYNDDIKTLPKTRQSMIYSLAKQESRFIPTSISTSYAMGVMQIMPFLARSIATQQNEYLALDDMFNPKKSYQFANFHLDYLEKHLKHPLFISYAYNGGIGFTKRMLQAGYFKLKSKFEPFLSMELVPYAESRNYGKKVLTNYVIYRKILNEPISLMKMVENIQNPY